MAETEDKPKLRARVKENKKFQETLNYLFTTIVAAAVGAFVGVTWRCGSSPQTYEECVEEAKQDYFKCKSKFVPLLVHCREPYRSDVRGCQDVFSTGDTEGLP